MRFLWPFMLWWLVLVPLLVVAYRRLLERRARAQAELGTMGQVQTGSGTPIGRRRHVPAALVLVGVTLLLVAMARPVVDVALPHREGTVVLAFDMSNSMIADDLEPSRATAAKDAARAFVAEQPSSIRIGVVSFSSAAFVVQPPTDVKADLLAAIRRLSPEGGTSIGRAILTSLDAIAGEPVAVDPEALREGDDPGRVEFLGSAAVVLLTDGENTSQLDPFAVSDVAAEAGVRVFPIGVGSESGAVVEVDGFNVATRLDEPLLREVAERSDGSYFRAEDAADLGDIYSSIDLQLTVSGEEEEITSILAGVGLLVFMVAAAFSMLWFGRVP
jgi:Ca-activated chloride channel family protein